METAYSSSNWIDTILWIWFALTAVSTAYVAWNLFTRTPEMKVMKWGWILVTLYIGIFGLIIYLFSCREPAPGTHEKFIAPLWKQSVGSTIHCVAGDATGIIVAAAITSFWRLPMGLDVVLEYIAGFAFGLLVFQALFAKNMLGGSYWQAVKSTVLPEWLSMNAMMAGMIPVMVILMSRDMRSMEPISLRFWAIMSLAALVGGVVAYPVNLWLVAKKLKHGMGTERALGKGGTKVEYERERLAQSAPGKTMETSQISPADAAGEKSKMSEMAMPEIKMDDKVSAAAKIFAAVITVTILAAGVFIASRYGDFSMRAGDMSQTPMENMKH